MATESRIDQTGDPAPSLVTPRATSARRSGLWKFLFLIALLGATTWGAVVSFPELFNLRALDPTQGALTYVVGRSPLQVTVTAEGNVESASNIELKCRVAGGSTILWIVEDGKIVEEGEELVRLDTSTIEDQLNSQRITYENALATKIQAQEDLEVAKIAVKEYEEGTYVEQFKQAEADIKIALENLRSAENQLKYSKRMVRKGFVSSLQREADEFAVERAKLDLDAANTRKKVLVEFTRQKTLTDLEAKLEAAAAKLRAQEAGLRLEKARLDRLEEQFKNCVITAPKKGMVVYANDAGRRGRFGSNQEADVEEGAMVRESQSLLQLPDLSKMQVKVTVHESRVDQLRPGMPARIIIQDQEYAGEVLNIANQPERTSWFSANVKEYATTVTISGENSALRPGMTAKVTILVDSVSDALTVPVSTVVEQRGKFYCWVRGQEGAERRPLILGRTNDKLIEIVDGVKEGDEVFRNPRAVTPEAREEGPFESQAPDAGFSLTGGVDDSSKGSVVDADAVPSEPPESGPSALSPAGQGAQATPDPTAGGDRRPDRPSGRGGRPSFDLMSFDQNGDQRVSREELPERMQRLFERLDANGDGVIDEAEIGEMRRRFESSGGRRRRGGGPDGSPRERGGPERSPPNGTGRPPR